MSLCFLSGFCGFLQGLKFFMGEVCTDVRLDKDCEIMVAEVLEPAKDLSGCMPLF